jgi:hypothetical protein
MQCTGCGRKFSLTGNIVRIRIFILLYLLTFFSTTSFSQYHIEHYTTENGLPSNGVKGLVWDDATDFLWIATEAGLVRYDGISFKNFDVNTNPEFGSNRIISLVKNGDHKILVASEEGNLSEVVGNKVQFYFDGHDRAKYKFNHFAAIAASDKVFRKTYLHPWSDSFPVYSNLVNISDSACLVLLNGAIVKYSLSMESPLRLD